jgi:hypothetical protein
MTTGNLRGRIEWAACLGLVSCWLAAMSVFAADAVDDLKQALPLDDVQNPTEAMLSFRIDNLKKKIDALTTIGQLRRALALDEWRDDPVRNLNDKVRLIDEQMRTKVGERLTAALDQQSKAPDASSRLAVANIIAEMGPNIRALKASDKSGFARTLTPQVKLLASDADVGVRQEALRALGTINGDPAIAAQIFADTLQRVKAVGARRAAAEGLAQLVRVSVDLEKRSSGQTTASVRVSRAEVLAALKETLLKSPAGFRDPDAQVRATCVQAFELAVLALAEPVMIPDGEPRKNFPPAGRNLPISFFIS